MIFNKLYQTTPIIVHAPGRTTKNPFWHQLLDYLDSQPPTAVSQDNLDIITWNSGATNGFNQSKNPGMFERSVKKAGLHCTILGRGIGSSWTNRMKIRLTIDHLAGSAKPYTLGVDSYDAALIGDPKKAVDFLCSTGGGMVFNAEQNSWPPLNKAIPFEVETYPPPFCHLNSGVWVAETSVALDFYRATLHASESVKDYPFSEQACIKTIYPQFHPAIRIDHGCEIFQCLWMVDETIIEIKNKTKTIML